MPILAFFDIEPITIEAIIGNRQHLFHHRLANAGHLGRLLRDRTADILGAKHVAEDFVALVNALVGDSNHRIVGILFMTPG